MIAAPEIQTSNGKLDARTGSGFALRIVGPGGLARLDFQADAVLKRIALALLYPHQDVFVPRFAVRILHSSIHLIEDPELVKLLL